MTEPYGDHLPATAVERPVAADPWRIWALITNPDLPDGQGMPTVRAAPRRVWDARRTDEGARDGQ